MNTTHKPLAIKNSEGVTHYLHSKIATLRAGKKVPIFFFMKESQLETAEQNNCKAEPEMPEGYGWRENPRNHMLTVYRKDEGQSVAK